MADQKISQLTDGGASQATDEYVIARSGANYRIDGASVAAAATSVGTLSSLTVAGTSSTNFAVFRTNDGTAANNAGVVVGGVSSATAASRQAYIAVDADGANGSGSDYFLINKLGNSGNV